MAKHGNVFYLELSREIFTDRYSDLSQNAKWLFVVLNELEHRFISNNSNTQDFFYRTNENLCKDAGMSLPTLKRAKAELKETDLIQTWQTHFINSKTKKLSEKHFTAYRILK